MQLKGNLSVQHTVCRFRNSLFEHLHALRERLSKTFFFLSQNRLNLGILDFGISVAHFSDDGIHQTGKEGLAGTELVAVTNGAAANTAKHISAAFVARQNAVSHRERAGTNVVSDHLKRRACRIHIGSTGFFNRFFDGCQQVLEEVDIVVAVHVLQNGGNTFQTHTGIHGRLRQLVHHTAFIAVKLHEHEVPNFNVAVAVFIGASRRAALNFFTMVIENFRARTAGTGVAHHPEVIGHVAGAFVIADTHDAFSGQTDFFVPNVKSFVIFGVDRYPEFFGRKVEVLCQEFPSVFDGVALEVVTETEVTQHFKECVVTCGVTDVIQVVVLAACADALLSSRCAGIGALIKTEENVLKLIHARVREEQRRIVAGNHRAGMHNRMTFAFEKLQKGLANLRSLHN